MGAAQMKATDARYTLQDSGEVMAFLERLVRWGGTPANGWHAARQCLGWKLGAPVRAASGDADGNAALSSPGGARGRSSAGACKG
jgi:hypothetical protein